MTRRSSELFVPVQSELTGEMHIDILSPEAASDILIGSFPYSQGEKNLQYWMLEWLAVTNPELRVDSNRMRGKPYDYFKPDPNDPLEIMMARTTRYCERYIQGSAIAHPTTPDPTSAERVVFEKHKQHFDPYGMPEYRTPLAGTVPRVVSEAAHRMALYFNFREENTYNQRYLYVRNNIEPENPPLKAKRWLTQWIVEGWPRGSTRGILDADLAYLESEEGRPRLINGRANPDQVANSKAALDPRTNPWASHLIDYGYLGKKTILPIYDHFFTEVMAYIEENRIQDTDRWRSNIEPKLDRLVAAYNHRHPGNEFAPPWHDKSKQTAIGVLALF